MLRFGDHFHSQSVIAPNTPYEVDLSDGSTLQGVSDDQGRTSLKQRDAMHRQLKLEGEFALDGDQLFPRLEEIGHLVMIGPVKYRAA